MRRHLWLLRCRWVRLCRWVLRWVRRCQRVLQWVRLCRWALRWVRLCRLALHSRRWLVAMAVRVTQSIRRQLAHLRLVSQFCLALAADGVR